MGALTERHRVPKSNQLAKIVLICLEVVYLENQALSQSCIKRINRLLLLFCNFMVFVAKYLQMTSIQISDYISRLPLMGSKCLLCTMYLHEFRHPVLTCREEGRDAVYRRECYYCCSCFWTHFGPACCLAYMPNVFS